MRAVQFRPTGDRTLEVVEALLPEPRAGEVRVKVAATPVHPADVIVRQGGFDQMLPHRESYRLGWDFSGTLDAVAEDITDLRVSATVVGMTNWLRDLNGTHAEYVVVPREQVVAAPASVGELEAAVFPNDASTAWQALDILDLSPGQVLVVIGAAGAVGGFALEIARHHGIEVIGVGSPADESFITQRGARFVDRGSDVAAAIRAATTNGADALFDTASLGTAALAMVRDGGRYCGVIPPLAPPAERGIVVSTVGVHSDPDTLARLVELVEQGAFTLRVDTTHPLEDAGVAFDRAATPGTRGAILILPQQQSSAV